MLTEGYDHVLKMFTSGKAGTNESVSFQSISNRWLYDDVSEIRHLLYEDTDSFKNSTTFMLHRDKWFKGYVAFESSARPNYFLRRTGQRLNVEMCDNTTDCKDHASWKIKDRGLEYALYFLNLITFTFFILNFGSSSNPGSHLTG